MKRMTTQTMMWKKTFYILLTGTLSLLATACNSTHEPEPIEPEYPNTVQLYIAVPQGSADTRIGDPGVSTGEGIDWNCIAIMLEYVNADGTIEDGNQRIVKTISQEEFDALPDVYPTTADATSVTKRFSIGAYPGTVHIYGVTYHSDDPNNPANEIEKRQAGSSQTTESFSTIPISNNYADESGGKNLARFLSVATGYYKNTDTGSRIFEIKMPGGLQTTIPTMRLTRLATKIDIQWDAADAYPTYKDVKVKDFTFVGDGKSTTDAGSSTDTGSGRLFPELAATNAPTLNGSKTFFNQTPISQRNGRVYHYVFPDGVSKPKVTFHLSGTKTDILPNVEITNKEYTFNFQNMLRQATWYKINTTIKGLNGTQTDINMSSFNGD
ncbi:hypothetical protein [uncultured Bacteroides sp.]|uniref:hypothetical protein n=1 Tax=uncultured Bacteroides sp. TaxID=162156 RepID=UPI0025D99C4F|nr:hypothetical protein [uncultured Bacteroides sp.]